LAFLGVDAGMMEDAGACAPLEGDEFIFDVQTHHVNPDGAWRDGGGFEGALSTFPQARCGELDFVDCFDADEAAATRCAIAEDDLSNAKLVIEEDPVLRRPSYRRAGPQSRREFLTYLRLHEGQPG